MSAKILLSCLILSSNTYNVPVEVLQAIHAVEGGWNGAAIKNTNGTIDMGTMQINSLWLDKISNSWNIEKESVKQILINDSCASASVAGWILANNLKETNGNLEVAIGHYHSRTPKFRDRYIKKVYAALDKIYRGKKRDT